MHSSRRITFGVFLFLTLSLLPQVAVQAEAPGNEHFQRTWARTDKPVTDAPVSRTWMWGPEGFTGEIQEQYAESPGGLRTVQYFDKSRMEISADPNASPDSIWYVTNGLLVTEMVTGDMQTGDGTFEPRRPARVNVAGDADDTRGITYEFFGFLGDQVALVEGTAIDQILTPGSAGNLYMYNDRLLAYGVTAAHFVPETQHTVASPFWSFMNSSGTVYENGVFTGAALFQNPFYATGFPISEAYWATVKVGGIDRDVLIQCFERRCLTYTPNNDPAWQVEAGNVGQHYHAWRYNQSAAQYEWQQRLAGFGRPSSVETDSFNNVYVADSLDNFVAKLSPNLEVIGSWDRQGDGTPFSAPFGIDVEETSDGELGVLYVTHVGNNPVSVHLTSGPGLTQWPTGELLFPRGIASDLFSSVLLVYGGDRIDRFSFTGEYLDSATIPNARMWGITLDNSGAFLITDRRGLVHRVNYEAREYETFPYDFNDPIGIAVDGTGSVYVADTGAHQIVKMSSDGTFITSIGS